MKSIKLKKTKSFQTAILFLVFNRPETTSKVFNVIKELKPSRLYLAADGPRENRDGEKEKVDLVRKIVTQVDWDCDVKKLFRTKNLGCGKGVSEAITWFFQQEEEGIILEDDDLPHQDFFVFCEEMLSRYRLNNNIYTISGNNFQNGIKRGDGSYYFSKYFHSWGWATWRRSWKIYNREIVFWPKWKNSIQWKNKFSNNLEKNYWKKIFDMIYETDFDSMAYPFNACIMYKGGLNIIPNINLVSNIGFGKNATHTTEENTIISNLKTQRLDKIVHPKSVEINQDADKYVFEWVFGGKNLRFFRRLFLFIKKNFQKVFNNNG